MQNSIDVLVLGTADWNQAIATNQHYVTREIAANEHFQVEFVESLGLRQPQISRRDLRRIVARLNRPKSSALHSSRPVPPRVTVTTPLIAPLHREPFKTLNRPYLHRQLRRWISSPNRKVLWTYSPVTYGLEDYADATIYHCVDLLATFPGIDEKVISAGERNLARRGVRAVASSVVVQQHLRETGFQEPLLWENVADTNVFTAAAAHQAPRVERAIFAGNLSTNKLDFDILEELAH